MQTTARKTTKPGEKSTKIKEKTLKDELPTASKKIQDEKLKRPSYNLSTPRNIVQKSTAADIYSQPNKKPITRAPKKVKGVTSTISNVSTPMKDLKSSPSSISQISIRSTEKRPKIPSTARIKKVDEAKTNSIAARKTVTPKTGKNLPFVNVTVNSPPVRRKLEYEKENKLAKEIDKGERERKKTRTLKEDEVKVLRPDQVDNNAEMKNLSRKLSAKPKAFFVDLDGEENTKAKTSKPKQPSKSSEDEISYEDDFESYESDFDSYHGSSSPPDDDGDDESDNDDDGDEEGEHSDDDQSNDEPSKREGKDEENMLDSGSFELREAQKSANKSKPTVMEFILEDSEAIDKKSLSTDEGFQDMSSSSAVSSMKTVSHVDVLDRPLFIDFKKSKENKRKRLTFERLRQRASDLLNMITLHEMPYTLFEMKPIPYDVYMATFGRNNYTQSGVQTFEDGITEEVQTDEVFCSNKWTQLPVKFSKDEIHLSKESDLKKTKSDVDYLQKFTFLLNSKEFDEKELKNIDDDYKLNPLRIYFEQKDGVGTDKMLPYETFENKLKNIDHKTSRLRKFLKKVEGKVSNILILNTGNTDLLDLNKNSKLSFSKGYVSLEYKNIPEFKFLKYRKVSDIVFSDTKSNFLMTVHTKSTTGVSMEKCLVCLWDLSVSSRKPIKILVAIDNLSLSRFRGGTDGVFVSALEDCSIHLWDLTEEPHIVRHVSPPPPLPQPEQVDTAGMTHTEIDREWNRRNTNVHYTEDIPHPLQACAYTSSALNFQTTDTIDSCVGLELLGNEKQNGGQDGGRKVVGQVCSLQRIGILTIWSIIQERKSTENDIGKAYWSKMKLEKNQTISLSDFIDSPISCLENAEGNRFNLTAAKRRLATKKSSSKDNSRSFSAGSVKKKKVLPVNWESEMLCTDLKVIKCDKKDNYLVAKNCGEVLCCTRMAGDVKVHRFSVTGDKSSITRMCVSPHGLPYFLAASEAGTLHLCTLAEYRVLLTLDCRNTIQSESRTNSPMERSIGDHKGRYIGTVPVKPALFDTNEVPFTQLPISSIVWCVHDPCRIITLRRQGAFSAWNLATSDIYATTTHTNVATTCSASEGVLAILTPEGEIQLHRLFTETRNKEYLELFKKYVGHL